MVLIVPVPGKCLPFFSFFASTEDMVCCQLKWRTVYGVSIHMKMNMNIA